MFRSTFVLALCLLPFGAAPTDTNIAAQPQNEAMPVRVLLQTEKGDIEVELDAAKAQVTVGNYLRYVDGHFYDGGRFHRTVKLDNQPKNDVKIEVIQAGVNQDKGKKEFPPIKLERTRDTKIKHVDGTISMARNGPDTATGDFFICIGPQPELDFGGKRNPDGQGFAAFGKVVKGMDVVKKIQAAPAEGQTLTPPVKILKAMRQASWSPQAAAQYLDERADFWLNWSGAARGHGTACLSCHTTTPYALARPALGMRLGVNAAGAVESKLIEFVKQRVENWESIVADATDDKDPFQPFYPKERKRSALGTESVLNALVLVNFDTRRGQGGLSATTNKALGHLWQQQKETGSWLWLDFGLNPWEKNGAYYGASLAALAVGTAGKNYYEQPDIQPKLAALKKYLTSQFAKEPLHHRVLALWASSRLPDLLSTEQKTVLVEELLAIQEADGGWSLAKFGKPAPGNGAWKSHGVYPEGAVSDGYATGLVVLALKQEGITAGNAKLQKAIAWLGANQKDGTWPISYPNRQRDPQTNIGKFMRDAATAYAVLALTE